MRLATNASRGQTCDAPAIGRCDEDKAETVQSVRSRDLMTLPFRVQVSGLKRQDEWSRYSRCRYMVGREIAPTLFAFRHQWADRRVDVQIRLLVVLQR
jgi:hypothetical protein